MNRRLLKEISIVLIMLLLIFIPCISFADDDSIIRDVTPSAPDGDKFINIANTVIGAMMWIGYACAIGMIVFIGIKYIMAAADEKATLKGMLVKVVIGSAIIVCSLTITNAVISLMSSTEGENSNTTVPKNGIDE